MVSYSVLRSLTKVAIVWDSETPSDCLDQWMDGWTDGVWMEINGWMVFVLKIFHNDYTSKKKDRLWVDRWIDRWMNQYTRSVYSQHNVRNLLFLTV